MRRWWWYRPFAAVLALWLLAFSAEPAAVRLCPLHDGTGRVDVAQDGRPVGVRAAAHATAGHAGRPAAADRPDTQAHGHAPSSVPAHGAGHRRHRGCTCVGDCCAASPVSRPTVAAALLDATIVVAPARPVVIVSSRRPSTPEHARPPSIGPPTPHLG
jgi:hypothetical protein